MARRIAAQGLCKTYRRRRVVSSVRLTVGQGEIVGLLGPNGAGKTTTFSMILGLVSPDEGKIYFDGADVTNLPMYQRARLGMGYLPQEASVFRDLTVRENLRLVLEEHGHPRQEQREIFESLTEELGLQKVLDVKGYALSGGERRRAEIARCLAGLPEFILLDEPFSGIDPIAVYEIQQIILRLRKKGYGILLTDHNVRETLAITDRACIIHQGQVVVEGPPKVVAESEVAKKFYLGERFSW
jgi:lipopolysaccharide export system ATP-binding protein